MGFEEFEILLMFYPGRGTGSSSSVPDICIRSSSWWASVMVWPRKADSCSENGHCSVFDQDCGRGYPHCLWWVCALVLAFEHVSSSRTIRRSVFVLPQHSLPFKLQISIAELKRPVNVQDRQETGSHSRDGLR